MLLFVDQECVVTKNLDNKKIHIKYNDVLRKKTVEKLIFKLLHSQKFAKKNNFKLEYTIWPKKFKQS